MIDKPIGLHLNLFCQRMQAEGFKLGDIAVALASQSAWILVDELGERDASDAFAVLAQDVEAGQFTHHALKANHKPALTVIEGGAGQKLFEDRFSPDPRPPHSKIFYPPD